MLFSGNANCPIGLDISDLSIKMIQLKKSADKIKIKAVGKTSLPPGLLVNGEIKNKEELAKAIKKLVSRPFFGHVNSNEAIACLPDTRTFLKIIEVDKKIISLPDAIKTELEKHIPLPLEEIYYDWQVIRDLPRVQMILVVAAQKKLVDQYVELLEEAKLSVVALETEPLSVCRSLLAEEHIKYKGDNKKNYALIDIGANSASMAVYSKNTLLFSVSMPISGEEITNKISETMNIEVSQAEKAKIFYSLGEGDNQPAIKEILQQMVEELVKKTKETLAFFTHHFESWGPVDKIILCGGGANIKGIESIIQEELGIETVRGDALINLGEKREKFLAPFKETISVNIDLLKSDDGKKKRKKKEEKTAKIDQDSSLAYSTAIGLALRGVFNND